MADSTQAPRTHTEMAERQGPTGNTAADGDTARSSGMGMVSAVTGGLGVAVGLIPRAGAFALILAVVALAAGIPSMREGRSAPGFATGRIGVLLGALALVVGILNIGIQLDWFTYFTTGD